MATQVSTDSWPSLGLNPYWGSITLMIASATSGTNQGLKALSRHRRSSDRSMNFPDTLPYTELFALNRCFCKGAQILGMNCRSAFRMDHGCPDVRNQLMIQRDPFGLHDVVIRRQVLFLIPIFYQKYMHTAHTHTFIYMHMLLHAVEQCIYLRYLSISIDLSTYRYPSFSQFDLASICFWSPNAPHMCQ